GGAGDPRRLGEAALGDEGTAGQAAAEDVALDLGVDAVGGGGSGGGHVASKIDATGRGPQLRLTGRPQRRAKVTPVPVPTFRTSRRGRVWTRPWRKQVGACPLLKGAVGRPRARRRHRRAVDRRRTSRPRRHAGAGGAR